MQENWIGTVQGLRFTFKFDGARAAGHDAEPMEVYTTRPDTLFGASFVGDRPDHPLAEQLAAADPAVAAFIAECRQGRQPRGRHRGAEKLGRDTGLTRGPPAGPDRDPAGLDRQLHPDGLRHGRDLRLPGPRPARPGLRPQVRPAGAAGGAAARRGRRDLPGRQGGLCRPRRDLQFRIPGRPGHRGRQGRGGRTASRAMDQGQGATVYRLRDWGVSRQRYWGCPIPVIHCAACGPVGVPEDQLPVVLPDDVTFDRPGNPLLRHPTWRHTTCPSCGGKAERETDTLDTFVDCSWYFARFTDPTAAEPIDKAAADHWMPVDQYIGGVEHAVLHLLYAALHHPRPEGRGPGLGGGAVRRPVHPGHGHPRGLQERGRRLGRAVGRGRSAVEGATARPSTPRRASRSTIGDIEKMSKSKKNVVAPEDIFESLRRRRRAPVRDVRQPARARRAVDQQPASRAPGASPTACGTSSRRQPAGDFAA